MILFPYLKPKAHSEIWFFFTSATDDFTSLLKMHENLSMTHTGIYIFILWIVWNRNKFTWVSIILKLQKWMDSKKDSSLKSIKQVDSLWRFCNRGCQIDDNGPPSPPTPPTHLFRISSFANLTCRSIIKLYSDPHNSYVLNFYQPKSCFRILISI